MVRVRELSRQVVFQTLTTASDGAGGYTETWGGDVTVWASIKANTRGVDIYQQGVATMKAEYTLICRFKDITPSVKMRVKYTIDGVEFIMQVGKFFEMDDTRKFWKIDLIQVKNG
jgi:head-tail adaptor